VIEVVSPPDASARGFLREAVDPQRYDSHQHPPNECAELILGMVAERARVLDVGCGSGGLAALLQARRQAQVIGVEPEPARAQQARALGLEVHQGGLTAELCQRLGQFDVVLFADVLEHVPDPLALLQLSKRLLRPGGYVVLSVPNVAHWSIRLNLLRGRFDYAPVGIMDATHLRWFTARSLAQLLTAADFELAIRALSTGLDCYAYWRPWYCDWRRAGRSCLRINTSSRPCHILQSRSKAWRLAG
jgi:methionine biosynthesis protein MetW